MQPQHPTQTKYRLAIVISGSANLMLAVSSLYWRELRETPALTVLAYRIILSAIILSLLVLRPRNLEQIKHLTPKIIITHCTASFLIAINWITFIWASINGYVFESGIGYLLAPLIPIALGVLIYKERIAYKKGITALIPFIAIILLIAFNENLNHRTYLLIATTWGSYTYLKKTTPLNAVNGLFLETIFLTACLALAIWLLGLPIISPSELSDRSSLLIWIAGTVSIIPLLMFSFATGKIPLALTGLIQFILPLTLLIIGLLFNKQKISTLSLTLIFVTSSLSIALITYDMIVVARRNQET